MATGSVSPKIGKVVDIPDTPTIGTVSLPSSASASVPFTPDTTKGGPVFYYQATSTPGSLTGTSTSSPVIVSGLSEATSYTFTVKAVNATGASPESTSSNTVTTPSFTATGGTVVDFNGYRYHTFTSAGTFAVNGSKAVEYLVVGAGGGGGAGATYDANQNCGGQGSPGAGGGGGGFVTGTFEVSTGTYFVTVGAGGKGMTGSYYSPSSAQTGGNSQIHNFIGYGGGFGATPNKQNAGNGGSGGGAFQTNGGTGNQGFPGGGSNFYNYCGNGVAVSSGGGGMGSAGGTNNPTVNDIGSFYRGNPGGYGSGSFSSNGIVYYACGGGSGAVGNTYTGGTGGVGGGGTGGAGANIVPNAGTDGFGGGGGGGGLGTAYNSYPYLGFEPGAYGGNGKVIVRYQYQ